MLKSRCVFARVWTAGLIALALGVSACSSQPKRTSKVKTPARTVAAVDDERPPIAEPPYPGSEDGSFANDPSMAREEAIAATPRPKRIDDEGSYHYGTDVALPSFSGRKDVAAPRATSTEGEFLYTPDSKPPVPRNHPDIEKPILTTTRGEFRYKMEETKPKTSASFRGGSLTPPSLKNNDNGFNFEQIYGSTPLTTLMVDYEWRLFSAFGRFGLKFTSGLAMAFEGQGRFRNTQRATELPDEKFTFVVFPHQLTAQLKFQFADKQIFVPYVEGGGGYFTFAEIRDDAKKPKFGGAPVGVVAGGGNFLLNWIDPSAIRQLDAEYGINHLWLTAEIRQFVGLSSDRDFSSTSINGGFVMEF